MKIAEMEAHHDRHLALESKISTMLDDRRFPAVFAACEDAFDHVVPAIQYRKKRGIEPETPEILSFSVICKYAPPLFAHAVLESFLAHVKATRVLAKHENGYLNAAESALEQEETARLLWNHIEKNPVVPQRRMHSELGVCRKQVSDTLRIWEEFGLIVREHTGGTPLLRLCSQLDDEVEGMCQACGVRGRGRRELFLKPIECGRCGTNDYFHLTYAIEA